MTTFFNPYTYIPDPDISRAVFNGFIYIGQRDTDPTQPRNRLTVSSVQEDGTLVALEQPIRTGRGGIPVLSGSPVQIDVPATEYSVTVQDRNGAQQYYTPRAIGANQFLVQNAVTHATYADFIGDGNAGRNFARTGDRGGSEWRQVTEAQFNAFPGTAPNTKTTDAGGNFWILNPFGPVNIEWAGAMDGGTEDATRQIQDALAIGEGIFVPAGLYLVNPAPGIIVNTGDTVTGTGRHTSLLLAVRGTGGNIFSRSYTDNTINAPVTDVLIDGVGVFLNHNLVAGTIPDAERQIAYNLQHISRSTVKNSYGGNQRHGTAATLFPNPPTVNQNYRGRAVLLGSVASTDNDYASGNDNLMTNVTVRHAERGISLDDDSLSDEMSEARGNHISNIDIDGVEIAVNQDRSTGGGNSFENINIGTVAQAAGSTNDTFLYRIGGSDNTGAGGDVTTAEANLTNAITFLDDATSNKFDPFRHAIPDAKFAAFANMADDGRNIVRYFSDDTNQLVVLNNGNIAAYIIESGSNPNGNYRKWSDGTIEQWGIIAITTGANTTVTLPTPFPDTNYGVNFMIERTNPQVAEGNPGWGSRTTTNFVIRPAINTGENTNVYWEARSA